MAVVIWRKKANRARLNVLLYGRREFGIHAADKMNQRIEYCTVLLSLNPQMGKVEPLLAGRRYEYRSLVVHEHYKLVYYINEAKDRIVIADLWDTRQEPRQLAEQTL